MDPENLVGKRERLSRLLQDAGSLLVAFSGGIDSTFLLAMAHDVLGAEAVAATAVSEIYPPRERDVAVTFAQERGVKHILFSSEVMSLPAFVSNKPDRCYHCKRNLFEKLIRIAEDKGLKCVAHGANADDENESEDCRPGRPVAREMGIISPLVAAGLWKQEIRQLSKEMGLSQWDKPGMACLAWGIPYREPITVEKLKMIDEAEGFLLGKGLGQCRVTHHGQVAGIQVEGRELELIMRDDMREDIVSKFREIGFFHIAVHLGDYVSGVVNSTP